MAVCLRALAFSTAASRSGPGATSESERKPWSLNMSNSAGKKLVEGPCCIFTSIVPYYQVGSQDHKTFPTPSGMIKSGQTKSALGPSGMGPGHILEGSQLGLHVS